MPDRRLVNEILTMIVAGHETTASTLNWTWFLISQHPEVEERLSNEAGNLSGFPAIEDLAKFPYSRQIIDESMRLYPAGWLLTRKALRDDRLGEYLVPAGAEVYVSPYFIHRNPSLWEDALPRIDLSLASPRSGIAWPRFPFPRGRETVLASFLLSSKCKSTF